MLWASKIQNTIYFSENYPNCWKSLNDQYWDYFKPEIRCCLHTGSKNFWFFGRFRSIFDPLLLGYHGNPGTKGDIFRSSLSRATKKCIFTKIWEILKINLVQSGTLYQKTGLKQLLRLRSFSGCLYKKKCTLCQLQWDRGSVTRFFLFTWLLQKA